MTQRYGSLAAAVQLEPIAPIDQRGSSADKQQWALPMGVVGGDGGSSSFSSNGGMSFEADASTGTSASEVTLICTG